MPENFTNLPKEGLSSSANDGTTIAMNGILVIDKPWGITSFDVVRAVRKHTGEKRVGHAGTLDPAATGVLVVCLGDATKMIPYLMDADKEYEAVLKLGTTTDTDDAAPEAQVLSQVPSTRVQALSQDRIAEAVSQFQGTVWQKPPRFSALKHQGTRLYETARASVTADDEIEIQKLLVEKTRQIEIHQIDIQKISLPEVFVRVRCGKGTYIRSLARDVGEWLGVGAHLQSLRRTRVGRFGVAQATTLDPSTNLLSGGKTHSLLDAVAHLPMLEVEDQQATKLRQGQQTMVLQLQNLLKQCAGNQEGALAVVMDAQKSLVAIMKHNKEIWQIDRVFSGSC